MVNKKRIFAVIVAIIAIIATITFAGAPEENQAINTRTIKFVDGGVINTREIEVGLDEALPEGPKHENQIFVGWYIDGTDIKVTNYKTLLEDTTLVAYYAGDLNGNGIADDADERFTVTFVDSITKEVIKTQSVIVGLSATAPEAPKHNNYTFLGWSIPYNNVTENITVSTEYVENEKVPEVKYYEVKFVDGETNEVISTQRVREGATATTPKTPTHNKKVFDHFEGNYSNVRRNVVITVIYADDLNENGKKDNYDEHYMVTFVALENGSLEGQSVYENVLSGLTFEEAGIVIPTPRSNANFVFEKWNEDFTEETVVSSNLTYEASFVVNPSKKMLVNTSAVLNSAIVWDKVTPKMVEDAVVVDLSSFDDVTANVTAVVPENCTNEAGTTCEVIVTVTAEVGTETLTYEETKNITIEKRSVTVTIQNKTSNYSDALVDLTTNANEVKYLDHDIEVELTTTALTASNVGDYKITASWNNENYDVTFVSEDETNSYGTYTITPKPVTVNVKGEVASYVYDQTSHSASNLEYTANYDLYNEADITVNRDVTVSRTNFGEVSMNLKPEDFTNTNANYDVTFVVEKDGKLTVTKNMDLMVINIKGNTEEYTYSKGVERTVSGYTTDVVDETLVVTFLAPGKDSVTAISAGTHKMGLKSTDFVITSENYGNITWFVEDGYVKINPIKNVTLKVVGNTKTSEYNYANQTVSGYEVISPIDETINISLKNDKVASVTAKELGKHYYDLTAEDFVVETENYEITNVDYTPGYIEIVPIEETTVTITGTQKDVVYVKGTNQVVNGYTTDVADKHINVELVTEGKDSANGVNVAKYEMGLTTADFNVTSDYYKTINVIVVDGYVNITPITDKVTITITGHNKTTEYNVSEQTVSGYDYTISVDDSTLGFKLKNGVEASVAAVNAGTHTMGLTSNSFEVIGNNYSNVSFDVIDGYLEITPIEEVTVAIIGNVAIKPYSYGEQIVEGFKVFPEDNSIKVTLKDGKEAVARGTEIGNYTMGLTKNDFEVTSNNYKNINYNFVDGELTITKIAETTVVITGNQVTEMYDGTEKKATGYTTNIGNRFITVEIEKNILGNPRYTASASLTNAGIKYMGLQTNWFKATSDYYEKINLVINDGFVNVTPSTDEIVVTITGNSKTVKPILYVTNQTVSGHTYEVTKNGQKITDSTLSIKLNEGYTEKVTAKEKGTYYMGLTEDSYTVTSNNYSNVKVVVVDGVLTIN